MSFSEWERRALRSIEDRLAGSDPGLASRLGIFSRLASSEEMPPRAQIRPLRRRAIQRVRRTRRHPPQGRMLRQAHRAYLRLGAQRTMLLLWAVISAGLIAVALVLIPGGHRGCAPSMGIMCTGQAARSAAQPAPLHARSPGGA